MCAQCYDRIVFVARNLQCSIEGPNNRLSVKSTHQSKGKTLKEERTPFVYNKLNSEHLMAALTLPELAVVR